MAEKENDSAENKVKVIKITPKDFNKTRITIAGKEQTIIVLDQGSPDISK